MIKAVAEKDNSEERSQRGMALLNHAYKSVYTEDYRSCLMSCIKDSQCKSFNYWWHTSMCDLNFITKYLAEAKFLKWDASSTYMGLKRSSTGSLSKYSLFVIFQNVEIMHSCQSHFPQDF